jgi:tRNA (mo5U34)-methyltransferase
MGSTEEKPLEGEDGELLAAGKPSRWEEFRLPADVSGKTFLDVGCWEGVHCADAVRRGAEEVVGVDLCTSKDLTRNVNRFGFEFLQMDVFGELWHGLGTYDVVLCSGVIYHVPNPMSLLIRLRAVCGEQLVLESATTTLGEGRPMMLFSDDEQGNLSNWWIPNRQALEAMLRTAGFENVETVWEEGRGDEWARACIHATPARDLRHGRLLPRKPRLMSVRGGDRGGRGGRKSPKRQED